jgi:glucan phosphoethanolaminetransferase (alkaline phosphatase superfamily)
MTIQLILLIIVGIVLFFIILKLTRVVMKALIITLSILLVLGVIVGITIVKDIKDGKSISENKFIQFFKGKMPSGEPEHASGTAQEPDNISPEEQSEDT